nr:hypothetical protein [Tanacetum cinerariifolium]
MLIDVVGSVAYFIRLSNYNSNFGGVLLTAENDSGYNSWDGEGRRRQRSSLKEQWLFCCGFPTIDNEKEIKMDALLIQHGCEAALKVLPVDMKAQTKVELNKKAHSAVILCLGNKVLREVTAGQKFFEHIDEFNKIVLDLANIEVKFEDEDLALLLLTSLPASYEYFMDTLLYRREALTLEDVMATLNSKEIKEMSKAKGDDGYVKKDEQPSSSGSTYDDFEVMSVQALLDWIMNSGCSYHMTPSEVMLEKQGLFSKKILDKLDFYENCVLRKSHQVSFGVGRHTTQRVIVYVHSELWGPSQVKSLGGKRYFLSIVDDYSRRYNGLAERMNRTLMDKVRSLLIQSGLLKTFWAEATCTAAYLINSCVAYPHDKQGKLEPRSIKCVLLGYPEGVKGYKIYRLNDEPPKIVTSRNVVFNESVMYKDTLKNFDTCADKSVEELHVKVELHRLNNHTPEEDQTDQEDNDDEDARDQETDQTSNLIDYQLARDREPRTRTKPLRFRDESNMVAYVFVAVEEEDTHEPDGFSKEEQDMRVSRSSSWAKAVRHTSIRVILALTACKDYELEQLDVKMAFLHENLEEVIYMSQPSGYERDDLLIACKSKAEIGSTKSLLKKEFNMKELEEAKKILGVEIVRDRSRKILRVSQSGYVFKILNKFIINNGKSVKMPLGGRFKLSLKDCPIRNCDVERTNYAKNPNKGRSITGYAFLASTRMCCKLEGNATARGGSFNYRCGVYDPYRGCEESYLAKETLGGVGVELNTVAVNCDNQGGFTYR